uniref:Putative nucleotide exchange factor sil1 n=1 Tax=Amblyomma parvum TaxID=251391 RepID=A0A023FXJ8_AMBPA
MLQKRLLCVAAAVLVFISNACCQRQGLSVIAGQDQSQKKDEEKSNEPEESPRKEFQPTDEWKQVQPGEAIPAGLHVRMNLATGQTEAKLVDESDSKGTQRSQSSGSHGKRLLLEQAKGGPSIKLSEKENLPWNMDEVEKEDV